jgi:CDP-diacylglycerol---glycerol-3-phosphate 3-phosphatidyltransferase
VSPDAGASSSAGRRPGPTAATGSGTNIANAVTLLRVALVPVITVLLFLPGRTARWWAFAVFAFAGLSDAADGWVARRYQGSTRWGQLADPAADKLLIVGTLALLALHREVSWWIVAVVVVREVAVTVQRQVLARRGVVMPASIYGKAKTVSQITAIALYLAPPVPRTLAAVVLGVAVVLTILSGLEYAWRGRRLAGAG